MPRFKAIAKQLHDRFMVFTGFYRVLPGFTGFYWVLVGFNWYLAVRALLSGFLSDLVAVPPDSSAALRSLPGFYRVLLVFSQMQVKLGCNHAVTAF